MGSGVCKGSGERILYAWGRNAPVLKLPKGKTGKYVVTVVNIIILIIVNIDEIFIWVVEHFETQSGGEVITHHAKSIPLLKYPKMTFA